MPTEKQMAGKAQRAAGVAYAVTQLTPTERAPLEMVLRMAFWQARAQSDAYGRKRAAKDLERAAEILGLKVNP